MQPSYIRYWCTVWLLLLPLVSSRCSVAVPCIGWSLLMTRGQLAQGCCAGCYRACTVLPVLLCSWGRKALSSCCLGWSPMSLYPRQKEACFLSNTAAPYSVLSQPRCLQVPQRPRAFLTGCTVLSLFWGLHLCDSKALTECLVLRKCLKNKNIYFWSIHVCMYVHTHIYMLISGIFLERNCSKIS